MDQGYPHTRKIKREFSSLGHLIKGSWSHAAISPYTEKNTRRPLQRISPVDATILTYQGYQASESDCIQAIEAGNEAQKVWQKVSLEKRIFFLHSISEKIAERRAEIVEALALEVGKPFWEAEQEVNACLSKISHTIESSTPLRESKLISTEKKELIVYRKPIGLSCVLAPFNFPFHLALGQIAPLLLAGNAVIMKPSELTPLCGQILSECIVDAFSQPLKSVFQMVQGDKSIGEVFVKNKEIKGVYFTGSSTAGKAIQEISLNIPGRMVALEMGGNNPLIIDSYQYLEDAIFTTLISSFITSGQRCSCARRVIIVDSPDTRNFLPELVKTVSSLTYGSPCTGTAQSFMGPMVSPQAKKKIIERLYHLQSQGAQVLIGPHANLDSFPSQSYINPLIIDCTGIEEIDDVEDFGPLLKIIRVESLQKALQEANKTRYGLSAALISNSEKNFDLFFAEINAGIINWNSPTTGASSRAPFGGIGLSGNFRPAGYSMIESCCYPVTSAKDKGRAAFESIPPVVQFKMSATK